MSDTVWLPESLWDMILNEGGRHAPHETGGMFMGYFAEDDYVVENIIGPGPQAEHSTTHFIPDHEYQQQEINRIFTESDRRTDYLGDWHTHPASSSRMSETDKKTLNTIGTESEIHIARPIMMIAGSPFGMWEASAWQFTQPRKTRWFAADTYRRLKVKIYRK